MTSHAPIARSAVAALALLLAAPLPARAQGGRAEAPSSLDAGDTVRVRTRAGRLVEGTLVAFAADSVRVRTDAGLVAVPTAEVSGVWARVPRASTAKRGAIVGGAAAFAWGAAFGGFEATLDGADGTGARDVMISGAAVGVLGVAGGGLFGAAIPWKRVYRPAPEPRPASRRRAALTFTGGYSRLTGDGGSTGGPEVLASFLGEWHLSGRPEGRRLFLSVGPEAGYAFPGTTPPRPHDNYLDECEVSCLGPLVFPRRYAAVVARGLTRLGVEVGAFRGYAVAGAGMQGWYTHASNDTATGRPLPSARDHFALGGTFGLGAQYRTSERNAVGIELRRNLVRTRETDFADGYWAVSATYTRTW